MGQISLVSDQLGQYGQYQRSNVCGHGGQCGQSSKVSKVRGQRLKVTLVSVVSGHRAGSAVIRENDKYCVSHPGDRQVVSLRAEISSWLLQNANRKPHAGSRSNPLVSATIRLSEVAQTGGAYRFVAIGAILCLGRRLEWKKYIIVTTATPLQLSSETAPSPVAAPGLQSKEGQIQGQDEQV